MKQLRISRNGLELASASLRQPVSTFGRSPSCDGVLRAPGVKPIHFLLESQGVESGQWVLFDISDDSGEGVVVGSKRVEFKGFFFEISDASLDAVDEIGGGIQRSVQSVDDASGESVGPKRLLEAVRLLRDSGSIQEVVHLPIPVRAGKRPRKHAVFEEGPAFEVLVTGQEAKLQVGSQADLSSGEFRFFRNGVSLGTDSVASNAQVVLNPSDWIRVSGSQEDYYFRWVAPVRPVQVPREVLGNPILRWGTLIGFGVALISAGTVYWTLSHPSEPVIQTPPRMATVQIKEAPPPPPPPAPEPQQVVKAPPQGGAAAAPKVVRKSPPKEAPKAGLNAPAPPTDVNQLGLLGALKASAPKSGEGVTADKIFDDGVVTQAATGSTGRITLKTPPGGAFVAVAQRDGKRGARGDGLQALSTTLSAGAEYAPTDAGPVGRFGADGKGLGSALAGVGQGAGSSANGTSSLDEASSEVTGGLDRETVRRVIASNRGKIRACYERALLSQPKLAGRVVTQFEISGKGSVLSAWLKSSDANSKTLESCLVEVVRAMVFPAAPNGASTKVIYPFVFQSKSQ